MLQDISAFYIYLLLTKKTPLAQGVGLGVFYLTLKMKVFLSLSTLEGGPIPLIEAMFCNAFPVVTDTGFARDVIREGINGFIIAADCDVSTIVNRIGKAYEIECDVSSSVIDYSWGNFVLNINQHLNLR